jgi:hypothetical protein
MELTAALAEQLEAAGAEYGREKAQVDAIQIEWSKVAPAPGSPGNPARATQLAARYNAEYERMCAKYLVSETSPFLKYLADFKAFLITEQIPGDAERTRYEKLQFEVNALPAGDFSSIGVYTAVSEYLDQMQKVFTRRHTVPLAAR